MFLQFAVSFPFPLLLAAHHINKVPSFLTIMDLTGHKPEGQVQPSTDPNLGICELKQILLGILSQQWEGNQHVNLGWL